MEQIANELRAALGVIFCHNKGDENMALRWVTNFENYGNALDVCIYLMQSGSLDEKMLFGVYKIVSQKLIEKWETLINAIYNSVLSFCVGRNSFPKYIANVVTDIFCVIVIMHPQNKDDILDELFKLCQQQKFDFLLFLNICSIIPSTSVRLLNYHSQISQKEFDAFWVALRNKCFDYTMSFISTLSLDAFISNPDYFVSFCHVLTNWYVLCSYQPVFLGYDSYDEEIVGHRKQRVSFDSVRIGLENLPSNPLMNSILTVYQSVNQIQFYQNQPIEQIEKLSCLYCAVINTIYEVLYGSSPSYASITSKPTGKQYLQSVFYLTQQVLTSKDLVLFFLQNNLSTMLETDPVTSIIDVLSRLVAHHYSVISHDNDCVVSILSFYIDILTKSTNYNYCNLITNSINEYFAYAQNPPECIFPLFSSLFDSIVKRCVLPTECFKSGIIEGYEDIQTLQKFRQSCQDVLLEIATSAVGVHTTAMCLVYVSQNYPDDLRIQESVLCLFCGIVDSIEEELFSTTNDVDLVLGEDIPNRLSKRKDIGTTPMVTCYDEVLDYIFNNMQKYAVHPLLLLSALQVMFSYDEWTFSRATYCSSLYQLLVTAVTNSPITILSRLLRYISRLFESPCFNVTSDIVHDLLQLSNYLYSLHNNEVFTVFLQTISTAICYIPGDEAFSLYQEFLQPFMSPLLTYIASPTAEEITEDHQIITCLKSLEACFDGCLVSSMADTLAEAILPTLQTLIQQALTLHEQYPSFSPAFLAHSICCVCQTILRASDISLSTQNTQIAYSISESLLHSSLAIQSALEIQDLLVSHVFASIPLTSLLSMITNYNALLTYILQNHLVSQELDLVKNIFRIETVVLKEKAEELCSQEQVVATAIQLVLQLIHENLFDEESIRLIIKLLGIFLQKFPSFLQVIYTDYVACGFQLGSVMCTGRLHAQVVGHIVQTLVPVEGLLGKAHEAVMSIFSQNQIAGLSNTSQSFREQCVVLFTTVMKESSLKSIVLDFYLVLINQISETLFLSRYRQV